MHVTYLTCRYVSLKKKRRKTPHVHHICLTYGYKSGAISLPGQGSDSVHVSDLLCLAFIPNTLPRTPVQYPQPARNNAYILILKNKLIQWGPGIILGMGSPNERVLHSNASTHWSSPYPEWSLRLHSKMSISCKIIIADMGAIYGMCYAMSKSDLTEL